MNTIKIHPPEGVEQVATFPGLRATEGAELDLTFPEQSTKPARAAQGAKEIGKEAQSQLDSSIESLKRKLEEEGELKPTKKHRVEFVAKELDISPEDDRDDDGVLIPPGEDGFKDFNDSDVLCGRGGGTNVHPGNRNFRDLINLHRRTYLKARKNDKPHISRAIVVAIRENGGRFLKKDEKTSLWHEVGDEMAREKAGQALRQRAPEMRKILFDSERQQRQAEGHQQEVQRMALAGFGPNMMALNPMLVNPMLANQMMAFGMNNKAPFPPALAMGNPAMPADPNQLAQLQQLQQQQQQMNPNFFNAALLGKNPFQGYSPQGS